MTDWVILRCAGRNTLALAESLNHGGFECWTPARMMRLPRKRVELPAPILPTYVFAAADRLGDLLDASGSEQCKHPGFSVFHYLDRIPLVEDSELAALRDTERRSQSPVSVKRNHTRFGPGETVNVTDGPWVGLSGVVERQKGNYTMVLFGRTSVKIATFLLCPQQHTA